MKTKGHWVYFEIFGKKMKYYSEGSSTQAEAVFNVHESVKNATKIISVKKADIISEDVKKKVKETIDTVHKTVDKVFEDFSTVFDLIFKKEKPPKK